MRKALLVLALALTSVGASRCAGVRLDTAMAAIEGGDMTALIEGCGNQLVSGYTYCRVREGQVATTDTLFFVSPVVKCNTKPCVTFKVYFPDGSPTLGGSIPEGQTRVGILWKDIVKRDTFELGDRGFWPYTYEVHFMDPQGLEHTMRSEGEIRMRVISKAYVPLADVAEDSNFAWRWIENGTPVKLTTGARTYIGKRP